MAFAGGEERNGNLLHRIFFGSFFSRPGGAEGARWRPDGERKNETDDESRLSRRAKCEGKRDGKMEERSDAKQRMAKGKMKGGNDLYFFRSQKLKNNARFGLAFRSEEKRSE